MWTTTTICIVGVLCLIPIQTVLIRVAELVLNGLFLLLSKHLDVFIDVLQPLMRVNLWYFKPFAWILLQQPFE